MFPILLSLILLASLLAFARFRRGRRIDDHPVCRRCRYDLHRLPPAVAACPECGHDLAGPRAILHGNRIPRPGLSRAALILATLCALGLAASLYLNTDDINWHRYKPFGWLLNDAAHATTADIMLVPNRKWENRSTDPTPPWGYPILFEDVPLPRLANGEQPTGRIHGKAILTTPNDSSSP